MSKGRSGNKKHGRNKRYCDKYKLEGRYEKNKAKKLEKHLARQPDDEAALAAYKALPEAVKKKAA